MKKFMLAATAAAALMWGGAASAATYVNLGPVVNGAFTLTFGNTGINTLAFNDVFDLNTYAIPWLSGEANFVVTSTMSADSQNIAFTSATFNGADFNNTVVGWNEFRSLNNVQVSAASPKILNFSGTAGTVLAGSNASYSGVITFAPTLSGAVPEPGAWALMIMGFGGAGALLRRNRQTALAAV